MPMSFAASWRLNSTAMRVRGKTGRDSQPLVVSVDVPISAANGGQATICAWSVSAGLESQSSAIRSVTAWPMSAILPANQTSARGACLDPVSKAPWVRVEEVELFAGWQQNPGAFRHHAALPFNRSFQSTAPIGRRRSTGMPIAAAISPRRSA
jgi:hypothetical protein